MLGEYCGREGRGQSEQGHTSPVKPDTALAKMLELLRKCELGQPQRPGTKFQCQGLVGLIRG